MKDRKKLLHIHSSVLDKQPTPQSLEYGELAVNFASGNTFISTKNSADKVVRFSEDDTLVDWMEYKEVLPYAGYVGGRGSGHTITDADLLANTSNLIIKLNQVAAYNTVKSGDVNEATDIYGNPVNPSSDSGVTDGAGFAIDMSNYALISGNPYFNEVYTNCVTGNHALNIAAREETNIGLSCQSAMSQTTNVLSSGQTMVKGGTVAVAATNGNLGITSTQDIIESSEGDIHITASSSICESAGSFANFYGNEGTSVGVSCEGLVTQQMVVHGEVTSIIGEESLEIEGNNACVNGTSRAALFGTNKSDLGINCVEDSASILTRVSGQSVNIGSTSGEVAIHSSGNLTVDSAYHIGINAGNGIVENAGSGDIENNGRYIIHTASADIIQDASKSIIQDSNSGITQTTRGSLKETAVEIVEEATNQIWNKANYVHLSANTQASMQSLSETLVGSNGELLLRGTSSIDALGGKIKVVANSANPSGSDIDVYAIDTINVASSSFSANAAYDTSIIGGVNATFYGGQHTYVGQDGSDVSKTTNVSGEEINIVGKGIDIASAASAVTINSRDEVSIGGNNTPDVKIEPFSSVSISSNGIMILSSGSDSATTPNGFAVSSNTFASIDASGNVTINSDNENVGISAKGNILNSAEGDIYVTANDNICCGAGDVASFYGEEETNIGVGCNGNKTQQLTIGGVSVCFEGDERSSVYGDALSDLGINCAEDSISDVSRVSGATVLIGGNNICENADNEAVFCGSNNTKIGLNCDGSIESENTNIYGDNIELSSHYGITMDAQNGGVISLENANNIILDGSNVNINGKRNNIVGEKISEIASGSASFYGVESTIIGANSAITVTESGNVVNVTSDKVDVIGEEELNLTSRGDIRIKSEENDIYILANNDICSSSANEAHFYGGEKTYIGIDCAQNTSNVVVIARRPEHESQVVGDTVDLAIDNAFERSKVTMSSTDVSDGHISKIYRLYQDSNQIGEDIVIPKDQFLKSARIVNGAYENGTFIPCKDFLGFRNDGVRGWNLEERPLTASTSDLYWHTGDKMFARYLSNNNDYNNVVFKDVTTMTIYTALSGVSYTNNGSAYTYTNNDLSYDGTPSCEWYIEMVFNTFDIATSSYTETTTYLDASTLVKDYHFINNNAINWTEAYDGQKTNVSADFNIQVNHNNQDTQFTKSAGKHSISSFKLIFSSGSTTGFSSDTFDVFNSDKTINIPTSVSHLNRGNLAISYGQPSASISLVTYDPSTTTGVTIPKSFDHLVEYNGSCYMLEHDICMSGNDVTARAFYSKSDMNLKSNIKNIETSDIEKASNIQLKEFVFKNDETKSKTYGVIAQDVNGVGLGNIVHSDADGMLSVDYTSLLILKIASLENTISEMKKEIDELKGKMQ